MVAARVLRDRVEPYIKQQAILYLSQRFDADVEMAGLHVRLPAIPQFKLLLTRGHGFMAEVHGEGIVLRRKGHAEPAILTLKSFVFHVDVGRVLESRKEVPLVVLDGLQLHVPPKSDRPKLRPALAQDNSNAAVVAEVVIDELRITNTLLVIHPADAKKKPLEFQIQRLQLRTGGRNRPMNYEASLRNPKPPGQIESKGTFGPWVAEDPGSSPLTGNYTFAHADLAVFKAIAGILESTGTFQGELAHVQVHGEARVPDFRLKRAANPMPLLTQFDVEVDGTNGNTILKPVHAQLANSRFVTSGAVIKHEDDPRRTIDLDVKMTSGRLEDFLRLAMKGPSFMEGALRLDAKIQIPPLAGKVIEKLRLRGVFDVTDGKFLKSKIQDRLDSLSRRAQGEPQNEGIDEVVSRMSGAFTMEDQAIEFNRLAFGVPGADIDLAGKYDIGEEALDFKGSVRLDAKVSQTQSGVKRWVLKPIDPLFARHGAGTFAGIKIGGTRSAPSFGLNLGRK